MRRLPLSSLFAASLFAVLAASSPALAGSDKAAADALYDQGKKLMASGDFEAACPKLAESQRLDPGVGTLLTLGDCYDHTGKRASAWSTFREAAALARTRGQKAREKLARTRAAALEPELSRLVIEVPASSQIEGLTVLRDKEPVGQPLWGTPVPIDAGEHTVVASAPGKKPWTFKVRVEKPRELSTVTVPALTAEVTSKPPPPRPPDTDSDAKPGRTQRILGFVAGGLGLGGLGAGIGLGLMATAQHNDAQAHCAPTCAAGGGDLIQADAKKIALGSTLAFAAGGVLLVGGVVLVITAPTARKPESTGLRIAPVFSMNQGGAVVEGAF